MTVAPSREDTLVAVASEAIGGPPGRYWRTGASWWTPVRVVAVLAVLMAGLGMVSRQHCRATGFAEGDKFVHACYSDVPQLFGTRGLNRHLVPYFGDARADEDVEYPVLTGAVMWATSLLVPGGGTDADRGVRYYDVNALLGALCLAIAAVATARTVRGRPWDAAFVALAPAGALVLSINWDIWCVMLVSLAMLAWARRRPELTGILLGLGTATKFYPLLLLGPLLLLCLRAGKLREFGTTLGYAVTAWLVVNVPVIVADKTAWERFYSMSRDRGAGFSSVWYVAGLHGFDVPDLDRVAGGAFAIGCIAISWVALTSPRRPRLAQLSFLVVAWFLLTNKVYSPQYLLWLVPLAAMARPRWRDLLIWQTGEVIHYFGIWAYLANWRPERWIGDNGYTVTVLAHVAGTLWLMAVVVRDVYRPEDDPVRTDAGNGPADDPGGGVLDDAPDVRSFAMSSSHGVR